METNVGYLIQDRVNGLPVQPSQSADDTTDQSQQQSRSRARIRQLLREFGGDGNGQTFRAFRVQYAGQREALDSVQEWARTWPERLVNCEGLVLYGPCGTGKDHLAIAAAGNVVGQHDITAHWRNGRDLFGEFRDKIAENETAGSEFRELWSVDLLVISDPLPPLGEITNGQADLLYRIAEGRARVGKPTILTLNVADEQEADRRLGAPTWDRFQDRAWLVRCAWPTHRKPVRRVNC